MQSYLTQEEAQSAPPQSTTTQKRRRSELDGDDLRRSHNEIVAEQERSIVGLRELTARYSTMNTDLEQKIETVQGDLDWTCEMAGVERDMFKDKIFLLQDDLKDVRTELEASRKKCRKLSDDKDNLTRSNRALGGELLVSALAKETEVKKKTHLRLDLLSAKTEIAMLKRQIAQMSGKRT